MQLSRCPALRKLLHLAHNKFANSHSVHARYAQAMCDHIPDQLSLPRFNIFICRLVSASAFAVPGFEVPCDGRRCWTDCDPRDNGRDDRTSAGVLPCRAMFLASSGEQSSRGGCCKNQSTGGRSWTCCGCCSCCSCAGKGCEGQGTGRRAWASGRKRLRCGGSVRLAWPERRWSIIAAGQMIFAQVLHLILVRSRYWKELRSTCPIGLHI